MLSIEEFYTKYNNKTWGYPTGSYVGECLSLVKWYIKECFGIDPPPSGSNSAYGYWSNFPSPLGTLFEKVVNTPTAIPPLGSIPIWDTTVGNGSGHIDIVLEDATTTHFTGFDQNWNGRQAHKQQHDYAHIVGWLQPKGASMATMYKGYDLNNPESMKVAVDVLIRVQNGEFVDKSKYDQDVQNAYAKGKADGQATAPAPAPTDPPTVPGWTVNGLQVAVGDKVYNYEKSSS